MNENGLVCETKEIWQLKILSLPRNAAVVGVFSSHDSNPHKNPQEPSGASRLLK